MRSQTEFVEVSPGRRINAHGVVVVGNYVYLPSKTPGHGAVGITSWPIVTYNDTTSPVTQFKIDEWEVGGGFKSHVHDGKQPDGFLPMDELFMVLSGEATFIFSGMDPFVEGDETVTLKQGETIFFPAGIWHTGRNDGQDTNRVVVLGFRAGVELPGDIGKGRNIP